MENNTNTSWTIETLKQHIDQRLVDSDKAVQAALAAADKAVASALLAADKAVASMLLAQKEAVLKAEIATEKRFEGVNEFRATLADQATNLLPRSEYMVGHNSLIERLAQIEIKSTGYLARNEHIGAHDALIEKIEGLTERLNKGDGKDSGAEVTMGKVYAAIAGLGGILGILVVLLQLFIK